mgnify:CR=1 FL=1
MADTTTKLISELDFSTIKGNLSAFIANNSDFTDYNFSGSALSILTDILAYNTHYNAVYLNMALNETFIDTAQTRSSVVSLAKNFGYTPRSKKSSITELSFTVSSSDPQGTTITIEKSDYFTSQVDNVNYVWYPIQAVSASADAGGTYTFTNNGSFGVLAATPVILQPRSLEPKRRLIRQQCLPRRAILVLLHLHNQLDKQLLRHIPLILRPI